MDRDKLYSIRDAASFLGGLSPWTIHSWLSQGRLQRVKVGSRTMIRESELLKMINDGSKPASSGQQPESELSKCEFIRPSDAARQLNIPLASVYALVRSGKMRAIYDTGRWKIPIEAVEERLKERGENDDG